MHTHTVAYIHMWILHQKNLWNSNPKKEGSAPCSALSAHMFAGTWRSSCHLFSVVLDDAGDQIYHLSGAQGFSSLGIHCCITLRHITEEGFEWFSVIHHFYVGALGCAACGHCIPTRTQPQKQAWCQRIREDLTFMFCSTTSPESSCGHSAGN